MFNLHNEWFREERALILVLTLIGVLLIGGSQYVRADVSTTQISTEQVVYSEHAPIVITTDAEFTTMANAEGWDGTGNAGDPIIITGLNITDTSNVLIQISNTVVYFVIEDCLLNGVNQLQYGINLETVINGIIRNNVIVNAIDGIRFNNAGFNTISGNLVVNNTQNGIHLVNDSDNNVIEGNTIVESNYDIYLTQSPYNTFSDNVIANSTSSGIGIYLYMSNYTKILDNTVNGHYYGIYADISYLLNITGNSVSSTQRNALNIHITTNTEIVDNHFFNGAGSALLIANAAFIKIKHNNFTNIVNGPIAGSAEGIEFVTGNNVSITENYFQDIYLSGIELRDQVQYFEVKDNYFTQNQQGLTLKNDAKDITISGNDFYDNDFSGIQAIESVAIPNQQIWIEENNFTANRNALRFTGSFQNATIQHNIITDSTESGIEIIDSVSAINIINNQIQDNGAYGVSITTDASNNNISHNDFVNNNNGGKQASDTSSASNEFLNNFWDDWTVPDDDNNGVVDQAYAFTSNSDQYPLTTPNVIIHSLSSPEIITPIAGDVVSGTITISWTAAQDTFSHDISYTLQYSNDNGGTWTEINVNIVSISISWNSANVQNGNYILKVIASDGNGLISSGQSDQFTINNIIQTTATSASSTTQNSATSNRTGEKSTNNGLSVSIIFAILAIPILTMIRRKLYTRISN